MLVVPTLVAPVAAVADPTSAASLSSRTLRAGVSGADVRELRRLLQRAGFEVTADGSFEAAAAEAVKAFQAVAGLTPSGTAGRKTVARLRAATRNGANAVNNGGSASLRERRRAPARPRARRPHPVRRGASGRDVKMLQDFLKRAGVVVERIDGEFGTGTTRAVRAWEPGADTVSTASSTPPTSTSCDRRGASPARGQSDSPRSAPLQLAAGSAPRSATTSWRSPRRRAGGGQADHRPSNEIATKGYRYGGGHGRWKDSGYDCSGSVSYALHGADLLETAAALQWVLRLG